MQKSYSIAFACVFVLAGCQCFQKCDIRSGLEGFDPRLVGQPEPLFPNIFISETGKIVLDQTPIRINKSDVVDGRVTIAWALPIRSPYTFPENAIQIGPVPTKDRPRTPDKSVNCEKDAAQQPTRTDATQQRTKAEVSQPSTSASALSPFLITGIELKKGTETGTPPKLQCEVKGGPRKVFECSFAPPRD